MASEKGKHNKLRLTWPMTILIICVVGLMAFCYLAPQFAKAGFGLGIGDTRLEIDLEKLKIPASEVPKLDTQKFYISSDLGFLIDRPYEGWSDIKKTNVKELLEEKGVFLPPEADPDFFNSEVRLIRYGDPIPIQFIENTVVNGVEMTPEDLELMEWLLGTTTFNYSNEIVVYVFDKSILPPYSRTLPNFFLSSAFIFGGAADKIVADDEKNSIMIMTSAKLENVKKGEKLNETVNIERWMLYTQNKEFYYIVDIGYMPESHEKLKVWEDLKKYMDSFHVID